MNKIFSYTAGYIDGDGCFYLGKTIQKPKMITVYEYSIQAVSVKKPVLDHFVDIFGGCIRKKPEKINHRSAYCWTIKTEKSVKCAQQIIKYLVDKKQQCEIYIQYTKTISSNNFKTVKTSIIMERENLISEIRKEKHMTNFVTKEKIESLKEKKFTVTIEDPFDYAYFAGLMDSEGCFRIKHWKPKNRPNDVYNITVEIGNTRFPILEWLVHRFGGSVCFIQGKNKKRDSATWTLSAAALYEILPRIRPYLITKQEVCDKLIEFQKTILPNGGDRHSELFRALFEKRREVRERIIKEVQEFNRTGSH